MKPGKKGWYRVKKVFGDEILNDDQSINRDKLGEIVFKDAFKRKQLNKCLHYLIAFEMLKQIFWYFIQGHKYILLDVPLLFETKIALKLISYTIVVYCDTEKEQIRRLIKRNPNLSEDDARLRIKSQMSTRDKLNVADYSIDNSKDLKYTRLQCKNLHQIFAQSKKYYIFRIVLAIVSAFFFTGIYKISKFLKNFF